MRIYKEGDKGKNFCENCKKIVVATYKYAPLDYNGTTIPNVLQSFCDICDDSLSIPPQSSFRIKEFKENITRQVEFRVPLHHIDVLLAIADRINISKKPNLVSRIISEFYIKRWHSYSKNDIKNILCLFNNDDLIKGKASGRLSCTFSDSIYEALKKIASEADINVSDLEKSIIIAAKHDVLDNNDKNVKKKLNEFAHTIC